MTAIYISDVFPTVFLFVLAIIKYDISRSEERIFVICYRTGSYVGGDQP